MKLLMGENIGGVCQLKQIEGERGHIRVIAKDNRERAAFIVRACNSHDELLDALKEAQKEIRYLDGLVQGEYMGPRNETLKNKIKAAIAKAEGGE